MQQMKHVFCNRLAACLCMKRPPSPSSPEQPHIYNGRSSFAVGDRYSNSSLYDNLTKPAVRVASNETSDKILQEIRDLLKSRLYSEEQQSYEAFKENEIRNDWRRAAVVFDRLCAVIFCIILVGLTVAFVVRSATHA